VRKAVLDATLGLLADGYSSFSIDAVAARAGVNKTTIYRNWSSKVDLILAAAKERSEELITTKTTADPERDLVAFLTSVGNNITSPVGQALVIATLNAADDPNVRKARDEFWRERFQAAGKLVRAAMMDRHDYGDSEVQYLTERLIAPLYLRVFITGAPVNGSFIRQTVRAALDGGRTRASAEKSAR
jgi:AcrR family transcriptional regulator